MTSDLFKEYIIDENEFSQILEDLLSKSVTLDNNTFNNAATTAAQQQRPTPLDPQRILRQMISLCKHIYSRGFIEGSGSDVTIKAFDKYYNLHRIILYQNSYFSVLLEGPWKEHGQKAIGLRFDDENITRDAFEFALGRLYGKFDEVVLPSQVINLLATASFLDLQDLCEMCVEVILRDIKDDTVVDYLNFATSHFYGPHSEKITESCFTYLCREGYDNIKLEPAFLSLPAEWLKRVIESDAFWVPSEYERYLFAKNIIGKRRKLLAEQRRNLSMSNVELSDLTDYSIPSSPTITTTQNLNGQSIDNTYNTKRSASIRSISSSSLHIERDEAIYTAIFTYAIYYAHMPYEELKSILHDYDSTTNVSYAPDFVVKDALWQQIDLRNKIENSSETDITLGISSSEIPSNSTGVHFEIPSDDTTHIGEALTGLDDVGGNKTMKDGEGTQLGVYLHRHSMPDPSPTNNFKSPNSSPNSEERYSRLMKNNDNNEASFSRYADKRRTVRTWFKILCPARGPSHILTQFQSSPDDFAIMQSWGWRSSSLCQDDYLLSVNEYNNSLSNSPTTLKFSVVMGHYLSQTGFTFSTALAFYKRIT
ncbi:8032_t:CDS:2 [Diversispora eburnea]|uniref:8032_t:CDS:1 n=1 Tax=Diversispora eburnea TaxID=1213867 RepID=A0A9N8YZH0_9GLOM|nr:8032_t:CDS:2 [Diversispora eburnea]